MHTSMLCSVCGTGRPIADPESGELVCSCCGLVFSEKASDSRPEWRNFDYENNDRIRTGAPTSLAIHDMGLATVIGKANKDSSGRRLDSSMNSIITRLRKWDHRTQAHSPFHRNLMIAFSELGSLKGKLFLSNTIVEKTAYIYRRAHEKNLIRGRSTSAMLAAAIYLSCRELGASRSFYEIVEATNVKRKSITRCYRLLVTQLDIKMPLIDPIKCIAKIANKAKLSEKTKRLAIETMNTLIDKRISAGKGPMGLAATVLYLSSLSNAEYLTQKDIASAAGVTEVTLRNLIKEVKAESKPESKPTNDRLDLVQRGRIRRKLQNRAASKDIREH